MPNVSKVMCLTGSRAARPVLAGVRGERHLFCFDAEQPLFYTYLTIYYLFVLSVAEDRRGAGRNLFDVLTSKGPVVTESKEGATS